MKKGETCSTATDDKLITDAGRRQASPPQDHHDFCLENFKISYSTKTRARVRSRNLACLKRMEMEMEEEVGGEKKGVNQKVQ